MSQQLDGSLVFFRIQHVKETILKTSTSGAGDGYAGFWLGVTVDNSRGEIAGSSSTGSHWSINIKEAEEVEQGNPVPVLIWSNSSSSSSSILGRLVKSSVEIDTAASTGVVAGDLRDFLIALVLPSTSAREEAFGDVISSELLLLLRSNAAPSRSACAVFS